MYSFVRPQQDAADRKRENTMSALIALADSEIDAVSGGFSFTSIKVTALVNYSASEPYQQNVSIATYKTTTGGSQTTNTTQTIYG
jgi:hypothetical protein